MAHWIYVLKLNDFYHSDVMTIQEKGVEVSNRIRTTFPPEWFNEGKNSYNWELSFIEQEFRHIIDAEHFDIMMEKLYDFGDQIISSERFPPTRRVWIQTI